MPPTTDTPPTPLPYLTAEIDGIGGVIRDAPEDFRVDEIPAYHPCGEGDHVYCTIEKRGVSTFDAVRTIARELGIKTNDIGVAGMKDKHAVTRQQISLPPPITPEQAADLVIPGVEILETKRHRNKLKTGHLRGNRFEIHIRNPAIDDASRHARAILDELRRAPGAPNFFGEQRFGKGGETAARGRELVRNPRGPRDRMRRLFISAFQAQLFNDYLCDRIERGEYRLALPGDLCQIHGHNRVFAASDAEQARLDAMEIAVTGPIFGHRVERPAPGTCQREREDAILARYDIEPASFRPLGKLARGTRRPLSVPLSDVSVSDTSEGVLLSFSLPSGSYATTILREVMKVRGANP